MVWGEVGAAFSGGLLICMMAVKINNWATIGKIFFIVALHEGKEIFSKENPADMFWQEHLREILPNMMMEKQWLTAV